MKYLVIGSGGREHCIAWRLMADGSADEVYAAPGNGGIAPEYRVNLKVDDFAGIAAFCREKKIDMAVIGPEVPLTLGIVDYLTEQKISVFGPTKAAAQLEGSKLFAKYIMNKYSVPTAEFHEFSGKDEILKYLETADKYPLVIKLDGLAAGKGVGIPSDKAEAIAFVNENVKDDTKVFTEEYINGEEASVLGISDGRNIKCLIAAQDHKRIFDGDRGPNTGGMGAYAPAPVVTEELRSRIQKEVMEPVINGMQQEGIPFKGILYAGLMISGSQIKVLEFNARFGDPETQVILPLLDCRLGDMLQASVNGTIDKFDIRFSGKHAITVVMASGGYPGSYKKGFPINGLEQAGARSDVTVFHAGTSEKDGIISTNGGRVLNVTALGDTLLSAKNTAYEALKDISFEGAFYRKDIAHRAL